MTETKQPDRPINCGTGYCSCIECPYEQAQPEPTGLPFVPWSKEAEMIESWTQQAQPERAPLTDDRLSDILLACMPLKDPYKLMRAIEQAHGIKQGGAA